MKIKTTIGLLAVLMVAGCAKDGSYNGPKIWGTPSNTTQPKTVWNTGKNNSTPPTTIWRRADGTEAVGGGKQDNNE